MTEPAWGAAVLRPEVIWDGACGTGDARPRGGLLVREARAPAFASVRAPVRTSGSVAAAGSAHTYTGGTCSAMRSAVEASGGSVDAVTSSPPGASAEAKRRDASCTTAGAK